MRHFWTALMSLVCAALPAPARAQGPAPASAPATRPSLDALIAQLGDHRFSVRDRATAQLAQMPPTDLDELVRRYREEPRYEQKLRLRYAIESVYYRRMMAGQVGFLGITLAPGALSGVYDPQTGQTVECIAAEDVLKDNAAARGGLRAKDIILDFDGRPIAKYMGLPAAKPAQKPDLKGAARPPAVRMGRLDPASDAFMSHVKMREPGTQIPLRVLREGEPRSVRVPVGGQPETLVDPAALTSTTLAGNRYAMLGFNAGGLVVTQVPEGSWMSRAGLRVNDAIVAVDGQPMPAGAVADALAQAFKAAQQRGEVMLEVRPLEQVKLTITLRARAPDLMNATDWEEAQNRLAVWWRDELGEPSMRFGRFGLGAFWYGVSPTSQPAGPEVVP